MLIRSKDAMLGNCDASWENMVCEDATCLSISSVHVMCCDCACFFFFAACMSDIDVQLGSNICLELCHRFHGCVIV